MFKPKRIRPTAANFRGRTDLKCVNLTLTRTIDGEISRGAHLIEADDSENK